MVMKNGSAPHMHQISNATISDVKMDGNNEVTQGSVTITMKDGPVLNVPTTWTTSDNNTLAIELDPSMVNNHFGESPIYGLVLTPEKEMNYDEQNDGGFKIHGSMDSIDDAKYDEYTKYEWPKYISDASDDEPINIILWE